MHKLNFIFLMILSFNFIFADLLPIPPEAKFESLSYHGPGCKKGSVNYVFSPDNRVFSVLYDDFIVDNQKAKHHETKRSSCTLNVGVRVPEGYSYALFCVDYRGYVSLEENAQASHKTTLFAPGGPPVEVGSFSKTGPSEEDYFLRTITSPEKLVWSSCKGKNEVKKMRIETVQTVKGKGIMTVDSADGHMKEHYAVAWRKCPNERERK